MTKVQDEPVKETLTDFQNKVDEALIAGDAWVQTTPEILNHYNRKGMGNSKYFIFKNIKVCAYGTDIDAIETEMETSLAVRMHGVKEARVVGREA